MKISLQSKNLLSILCGLALLAACTPAVAPTAAIPTTAAAPTSAAGPANTAPASETYSDPFAYCNAVGTVDLLDARYSGPKTPDAVVKGVMKASGAAADAPVELFSRGTVWRCMNQQVYACFVGANLPCESKANTSQEPTAEMNEFCKANPGAEFLPAAVTGHATIYQWSCKKGIATAGKPVFQVDQQGYIREIWYMIVP